ncbi:MAG: ferrous iron transport protein A [Proteobacteria bacterium]|nr:ferrous iron transport protein A [Pseudomonadota bacterium]
MSDTNISLKDMTVGTRARVSGYAGAAPAYRKKLLAMGLTPGVEVKILRYAPLGDPIEILVRGYTLALRKHEASVLQLVQA